MSTKKLNIVSLSDGSITKKSGTAVGEGVFIKNQNKEVSIVENGIIEVLPDEGFTGLSKVQANVDVPLNTQEKTIEITDLYYNKTIYPDSGYSAFSKVIVNANATYNLEEKTVDRSTLGEKTIKTSSGYQGMSKVIINQAIVTQYCGFEVEVKYGTSKGYSIVASAPFKTTWENVINNYGTYEGLDSFILDNLSGNISFVDKYGSVTTFDCEGYDTVESTKYVVSFPSVYTTTINGVTYRASVNTLWKNWITSSYNTGGFTIDDSGYVKVGNNYLIQQNIKIVDDTKYVTSDMTFCHNGAYSLTDIKPLLITDKITFSGSDVVSVSGVNTNTLESLKLNGVAVQNGTPTAKEPISICTNKGLLSFVVSSNNLLDVKESNIVLNKYLNNAGAETASSTNFYIAKFIKVKPNTPYTASFSVPIGYFSYMEYDENFTFIKRTLVGGGSSAQITSNTHTMGETTHYVVLGSNPISAQVTNDVVLGINWMFNEGSTALPYEPYSEGLVVNGSDVISIQSKNLNEGTLRSEGYTSTGGVSTSTTFCGTLHKIKTCANKKYTVSFGNFHDGVSGVFVNTWKTDGSWNTRQAISSSGKLNYTIPEGIGWVNFTLYKTGGITITEDSWLQVELGTDATSYVDYALYETAEADLLLGVGTYADIQDIITGESTKKVGIAILDGTEIIGTSNKAFTIGISDKIRSKSTLLCTHFKYSSSTSSAIVNNNIISFASQNVGFRNDDCADVQEFKKFLQAEHAKGTPVIVIYPLANEVVNSSTSQNLDNPEGTFIILRSAETTDTNITAIFNNIPDIRFFVNNSMYKAKEGMSWEDWINSSLCPTGTFSIDDSWVYKENKMIKVFDTSYQTPSDIIRENFRYNTIL